MEVKTFKDFAEEIRARANIIEVIGSYIELRRSGINHKGLCPFHKEKTPSFMVQERKQFFHCFGCHAGGDVVSFVMKIENLDYRSAVEFLAKRYNVPVPRFKASAKSDEEQAQRDSMYDLMQAACEFYAQLLKSDEGKQAREYLVNRGFDDETTRLFMMGFGGNPWDGFYNFAKKKNFSEKIMLAAGMISQGRSENNYYDRFRERVIFPIADIMGRIVAFGGRIMGSGEPKYLNSPETPVYKKGQILYNMNLAKDAIKGDRDKARLLLVEGYIDAITVYRYGFKNVVASLGTALTEQQAQLIKRYVPEVVFIYDGDEAGQKSMLRGIEILLRCDVKTKVVMLPENLDPDSFLRKYGAEKFAKLLNEPYDFFDFILAAARKKFDIASVEGKVSAITLFAPFMLSLANPIYLDFYLGRLADSLSLDKALVSKYLSNFSLSQGAAISSAELDKTMLTDVPPLERNILKMLFDFPLLRETHADTFPIDSLSHIFTKKWIALLLKTPPQDNDINALAMQAESDAEGALLREIALSNYYDETTIMVDVVFKTLLERLRLNRIRRSIKNDTENLAKTQNDKEKFSKLGKELHNKNIEKINIRKNLKNR